LNKFRQFLDSHNIHYLYNENQIELEIGKVIVKSEEVNTYALYDSIQDLIIKGDTTTIIVHLYEALSLRRRIN